MSITESQRTANRSVQLTATGSNQPAEYRGYVDVFGPRPNLNGMRNMYSQKLPAGTGALARRGIANVLAGQFQSTRVVPFKRRVPSFFGPPAGTK